MYTNINDVKVLKSMLMDKDERISEANKQISELQEKLAKYEDALSKNDREWQLVVNKAKDVIHRRNLQIKDLKATIALYRQYVHRDLIDDVESGNQG